jgi:WD40 repeat protein
MMRNILLFALILVLFVSCSTDDPIETELPTQAISQTDEETHAQDTTVGSGFELDLSKIEVISPENIAQLQELDTLIGHSGVVASVSISPDGSKLASGGLDRLVRLWDLSTGSEYAALRHGPQAFGTDFDPDNIHLASAGSDKYVRVWNVDTAEEIYALEGHSTGVTNVFYSPSGDIIASASRDGVIYLWDSETGQEIRSIRAHFEDIYGLAYHPDGTMIASASVDETVGIWDPATGEKLRVLEGHEDYVFYIEFSPDGDLLVSCGGGISGRDNSARIWDTSSWEVVQTISDRESAVVGCGFSVDGKLLITRESGGIISFWDRQSMELLHTLTIPGEFTYSIDMDPEGRFLAIGYPNGEIHLFGVPE